MTTDRFEFHHRWTAPAPAGALFDVLADADRYVEWWPQVRRSRRLDDESGEADIRSLAPVTLRLVLTREVEDRAAGLLRVRLDGDLVGSCGWRVGDGVADFDQACVVAHRWLAPVAPRLRPLLVANHAWMMRGGEHGLRAHLANPTMG